VLAEEASDVNMSVKIDKKMGSVILFSLLVNEESACVTFVILPPDLQDGQDERVSQISGEPLTTADI